MHQNDVAEKQGSASQNERITTITKYLLKVLLEIVTYLFRWINLQLAKLVKQLTEFTSPFSAQCYKSCIHVVRSRGKKRRKKCEYSVRTPQLQWIIRLRWFLLVFSNKMWSIIDVFCTYILKLLRSSILRCTRQHLARFLPERSNAFVLLSIQVQCVCVCTYPDNEMGTLRVPINQDSYSCKSALKATIFLKSYKRVAERR